MTRTELRRNVRQLKLEGDIREIQQLLEIIRAILNDPDPLAAGLRSNCARQVLALAEELVEVIG